MPNVSALPMDTVGGVMTDLMAQNGPVALQYSSTGHRLVTKVLRGGRCPSLLVIFMIATRRRARPSRLKLPHYW
ncbi:hypothetical protein ABZ545_29390 [Streptomyces abikoensis]|uniref:Uncharacterized protein n=1 Tax=Streptomyces abikoensis TaxID=97398 RepID=A0ABW7TEG0_9ACTN